MEATGSQERVRLQCGVDLLTLVGYASLQNACCSSEYTKRCFRKSKASSSHSFRPSLWCVYVCMCAGSDAIARQL